MKKSTSIAFFWIFLFVLFLTTRLYNLLIIPIFTDEAIYSYWAQVALHDPSNRFISLEDGKQPLFIWLSAIVQKFVDDPLLGTRLVSVFAGLGSAVGIFFLTKEFFNEKTAKISSFLYVILPFTLLYDRMALYDSLLTMLGIYAIFLSIKMVKDPRLDLAILNGLAIGLSLITKSSGAIYLYLLPASLILFNKNITSDKWKFIKWLGFASITLVISQIIYNSLRLSPLFYIISQKNLSFIRPLKEVVSNPFLHFFSNLTAIFSWIVQYIGFPLVLVFLLGVLIGIKKRELKIAYLSILVFSPILAEALFNQVLYPRFILFYFPFILIIIAYGIITFLDFFKSYKKLAFVLLLLCLVLPTYSSFKLLTNPIEAKIADSDYGQYINDWPSGYGISETVTYLKQLESDKEIYVGTEGTFGLLPYALQIYFFGNQKYHFIGYWPVDENNLPKQILDISKTAETFFVFNENQKEIKTPNLKLISQFKKGNSNGYLRLYKIIP